MNTISQAALDYLPKFRAWLEAQTVDRQVLADAGSIPPPYLLRIPDPKWAAMLEVAKMMVLAFPTHVFTSWAGLPQGALAGAIREEERQRAKAVMAGSIEAQIRVAAAWRTDDIDLAEMQAVMGVKP